MAVVNAAETAIRTDFHIRLVLHGYPACMLRVFTASQCRQMGNTVISSVKFV